MVQSCHRKHFLFQAATQADVKQHAELLGFKSGDLQLHPGGFKRAGHRKNLKELKKTLDHLSQLLAGQPGRFQSIAGHAVVSIF